MTYDTWHQQWLGEFRVTRPKEDPAMTPAEQQTVRADVLAEHLEECGHEITRLDILDALASTGLILTRRSAIEDPASDAYLAALQPKK